MQIVRGLESNWAEYIIFDIGSLILHRGRIGKLINPMMKICLKDFFSLSFFFEKKVARLLRHLYLETRYVCEYI